MITFKDLNLAIPIQETLEALGFNKPTEIQQKAIPLLLSSNKMDFHGQAQTGTGKTLAFGIPLMHRIIVEKKTPQALIVAPTRELALQIRDSIAALARTMSIKIEAIYGGTSMEEQIKALARGVHIVVGTPGRLNDHLRRKTLIVDQVGTIILDEADIMLDMGFKEEVDEILSYVPASKELWLFSATVKSGIHDIMQSHMRDPRCVRVSTQHVGTSHTKQYFAVVPLRLRLQAVARFIESSPDFYGFIFCQTKILTSELAEQLIKRGYSVGALHGDMGQTQRNLVIKKFKNRELAILVATDVAARGIDIANLTHVINFSIPEDLESYVHRIGRTGRAGKNGTAITFVNKMELRILQHIENKFNVVIEPLEVPSHETVLQARLQKAGQYLATVVATDKNIPDQNIFNLIKSYSMQELQLLVIQMIHDKFLSTISSPEEICYTPAHKLNMPEHIQEVLINLGSENGITREDVIGYLTKSGCIQSNQIFKIRIIKHRTFIELPAEHAVQLLESLRGKPLAGRRARISMVTQERD